MRKLTIAALTLIMLPAFSGNVFAKTFRSNKKNNAEMLTNKVDFTKSLVASTSTLNTKDINTVNVDYIIHENGKPYITYINSNSPAAKQEVIKFLESAVYDANMNTGKIYSMKFMLNQ